MLEKNLCLKVFRTKIQKSRIRLKQNGQTKIGQNSGKKKKAICLLRIMFKGRNLAGVSELKPGELSGSCDLF